MTKHQTLFQKCQQVSLLKELLLFCLEEFMLKYYGYLSEAYSRILQISLFRSYPVILRTSSLSQRDLILYSVTQCLFFSLCMFLPHYQEKRKKNATVGMPKSLLPLMYSTRCPSELNSEIPTIVFYFQTKSVQSSLKSILLHLQVIASGFVIVQLFFCHHFASKYNSEVLYCFLKARIAGKNKK